MVKGAKPKRWAATQVAAWRLFREMSQAELAERAGVSEGTIAMLETGHRQFTQGTLEAVAKVLECSVVDLLVRDPYVQDPIHEAATALRAMDPAKARDFCSMIIHVATNSATFTPPPPRPRLNRVKPRRRT